MGPLELADLIGLDVNLAVSESLYERSYHQPRFRPSSLQRSMVEAGLLGRKTGQGFYEYDGPKDTAAEEESAPSAVPGGLTVVGDPELARALGIEPNGEGIEILALEDGSMLAGSGAEVGVRRMTPDAPVIEFVGDTSQETRDELEFAIRSAGLEPAWTPDLPGGAALRTVAALVNEAFFALEEGVASASDIDRAMQLGANYPKGPLAWADELGHERILRILNSLQSLYGDSYLTAPLLRRRVASDKPASG